MKTREPKITLTELRKAQEDVWKQLDSIIEKIPRGKPA